MIEKRYQVFVSSTFRDLIEERQEVTQALLELDCMPAGMELFPAANDDQWTLIKKVIDDCDYYIVIMAGKYGSIGPEGLSYTEMEYKYALDKGKPIIAFLFKDLSKLVASKVEAEEKIRSKVEDFRLLAQKKLVRFWETPAELGSVVSRSLIRLIKTNPAIGWVKGDQLSDEASTAEILRLRKIIDDLESKVSTLPRSHANSTDELAKGDEIFELDCTIDYRKSGEAAVSRVGWTAKASWNFMFSSLAPLIADEASDEAVLIRLSSVVYDREFQEIEKDDEFKNATIETFEVDTQSYETCMLQFTALGLIENFKRKSRAGTLLKIWRITEDGEALMFNLRAIKSKKS